MNKCYELGIITINFPDENQTNFSIFEDLAELFGKEYQSEAVKLLSAKLKDIKPKPTIDYESDNVSITTSNTDTLLSVIDSIIELCTNENKKLFLEINREELNIVFENAKKNRPKPKKSNIGDVFVIPLCDNTFSIGQVIDKKHHCTCALFEIRINVIQLTVSEFKKLRPISILHLSDNLLSNGTWEFLFNEQVTLNPNSGCGGRYGDIGSASFSPEMITDLANAYWGILPWNVMFDENFYDHLLLNSESRPSTALVLNEIERQKYRKDILSIN
jgi:hypothetical protein